MVAGCNRFCEQLDARAKLQRTIRPAERASDIDVVFHWSITVYLESPIYRVCAELSKSRLQIRFYQISNMVYDFDGLLEGGVCDCS